MNILLPGKHVHVGQDPAVKATIIQVSIKSNDLVKYQVVWWEGTTRNSAWIYEHEFTSNCKRERLGFK